MAEEKKISQIWLKLFIGLFYLFIFFILLQNSFNYLDPDFGWHLKTGERIWQTKAVPSLNYENYTLEGKTWVDHEWLMNLITYIIYHNFGYIVLSIFFALIILAVLLIQLQFVRKNFLADDRGLIIFLVLQFFGLYASLPHLGLRMQEITILNLLLLIIIIFYFNKNKSYKILFWLVPLFIFWASAHAGFLIGFFILGLFAVTKILELLAKKLAWNFIDYEKNLTLKQIGIFTSFSFLALVATLATPYGLKLYEFLSGYGDKFYQAHIGEWQGQYFFPFQYPQLIYLEIALLFLTLSFFTVFVFKKEQRQRIDLWELFLVIIFSFLAMRARRHFPLLFIISLPILVSFFVGFFNLKFSFLNKIKIRSALSRALAIFIFIALLLASAAVAIKIDFTNQPEIQYKNEYPLEAIKFLRTHPEWNDRRIFNEYGWGGYLIWQHPERKLFIDGRLPQFKLNSTTMLEEYFSFFAKEKTAVKLKEYDIGLVLLRVDSKMLKIHWWEKIFFDINEKKLAEAEKKGFTLRDYLLSSPDWQTVYNDGKACIFVKK
jgi:hypothetical protein